MTARGRMIIDTDTGVDDAIAIMMALSHPSYIVDVITMVRLTNS